MSTVPMPDMFVAPNTPDSTASTVAVCDTSSTEADDTPLTLTSFLQAQGASETLLQSGCRELACFQVRDMLEDVFGPHLFPRVRIWQYGSAALDIFGGAGSDVDLAILLPRDLDKREYQAAIYRTLSLHTEVSDLTVVDGMNSLISFNWCPHGSGTTPTPFDLHLEAFPLSNLPQSIDDLANFDDLYSSIEFQSQRRTLAALRIPGVIRAAVPADSCFRQLVLAVKFWAKNRGVYSNKFGFLGGLAWSVLAARTVQEFPSANLHDLMANFFLMWSEWRWDVPAGLKFSTRDWKPTGPYSMAVLSPVPPHANTAAAVPPSLRVAIVTELRRAAAFVKDMRTLDSDVWTKLFARVTLDDVGPLGYVEVSSSSCSKVREWVGLVGSRLPRLVRAVETASPHVWLRPHTHHDDNTLVLGVNSKTPGLVLDLGHVDLSQPVSDWLAHLSSLPSKPVGAHLEVQWHHAASDTEPAASGSKRSRPETHAVEPHGKRRTVTPTVQKSRQRWAIGERPNTMAALVVIDGANVCWEAGDHLTPRSEGIFDALRGDWGGAELRIFLPHRYVFNRNTKSLVDGDDTDALRDGVVRWNATDRVWENTRLLPLVRSGLIVLTPPPPLDDLDAIHFAMAWDAIIVSNDHFRDHAHNGNVTASWLTSHRIGYQLENHKLSIV